MSWSELFMLAIAVGVVVLAFCGLAGFSPRLPRARRKYDVGGEGQGYDSGGGDGGGGGD